MKSVANVLVLGTNSVHSLRSATLISQVDSLLENHRIEDAVSLAEQQKWRIQERLAVNQDEVDELHYVYQRIGFQCLLETLFDDASRHFYDGELDPRALLSYYPHLCGTLFKEGECVDLFSGIAESMPQEESIDDIIMNYSPHLSPNTREAPAAIELRQLLKMAATDMLKAYLKKWRTRRVPDDPGGSKGCTVPQAVDTVLCRLYCEAGEKTELLTLVINQNSVVVEDVESLLVQTKNYDALCTLYQRRQDDVKLLEIWSKLVSGEYTDSDIEDPLSRMFVLLNEKKDRSLVQQWGVWLTKQDSERGLKLLTSFKSGRRNSKAEDDQALLQQIAEASPQAGTQYLEHLVLQKRSTNPSMHTQLAQSCVDQVLECLADESISKLWRAKVSSYSSSRNDATFLSYFSSTTPDSDSKRVRLKTIMFLQGSSLYDPHVMRPRLEEHEKILGFELAILDGKLGQDQSALSILVHTLRDSASAEAYCTLGGEVIPASTAQSLGERYSLQPWASLFVPVVLPGRTKPGAVAMKRQKTVEEDRKKELTKILLQVYMDGGDAMAERTAQLINAQAMNLEVMEVLSLVPRDWPLSLLSNFLGRSFRRTLHSRHEGQIVKAVSASENLAVAEKTWLVMREEGAVVEEAADDEDDDEDENFGDDGEKESGLGLQLDEKVGMRGYDVGEGEVDGTKGRDEAVEIPHGDDIGELR